MPVVIGLKIIGPSFKHFNRTVFTLDDMSLYTDSCLYSVRYTEVYDYTYHEAGCIHFEFAICAEVTLLQNRSPVDFDNLGLILSGKTRRFWLLYLIPPNLNLLQKNGVGNPRSGVANSMEEYVSTFGETRHLKYLAPMARLRKVLKEFWRPVKSFIGLNGVWEA